LKKLPVILLLLSISIYSMGQTARAQNKPGYDYKQLHFGFMVGLNTMDFAFKRPAIPSETSYFADVSNPSPGFQVSIVSDLRMGDRFSLRFLPGITFGSRELSFYELDSNGDYFLGPSLGIESNFLDFPLLVKYKSWRVNNYRPYFIGGFALRYDMAKRAYLKDTDFVTLNPLDVYLEIGFGIDLFLQYFKFAPEIKVSAGLRDVMVQDNDTYGNSIEALNSYVVMLCFYFE
jgi:hypothetical protein